MSWGINIESLNKLGYSYYGYEVTKVEAPNLPEPLENTPVDINCSDEFTEQIEQLVEEIIVEELVVTCKEKKPQIEIKIQEQKPPDKNKLRKKYYSKVNKLTNSVAHNLPNIELRSFRGGYHIDHIVPKSLGYKLGIPAELIASLENLRMLPELDNLNKSYKLTEEAELLLKKWGFVSKCKQLTEGDTSIS